MRTFTSGEIEFHLRENLQRFFDHPAKAPDIQTDNQGQLVIYTNVWQWNHPDGSVTYHDEPQPNYSDDF